MAQSRIITEQGGNIVMWSSNGDIDAGEGAKTSVSAPRADLCLRDHFHCPPIFEARCRALAFDDNLFPACGRQCQSDGATWHDRRRRGRDPCFRQSEYRGASGPELFQHPGAGCHGRRAGCCAPNIGALSDASTASGAATKAITATGQGNNNSGQPSILIVEIEGYGGDDDNESTTPEQDIKKKPQHSLRSDNDIQDPRNRVQVLGAGPISEDDALALADERRRLVQH